MVWSIDCKQIVEKNYCKDRVDGGGGKDPETDLEGGQMG